MDTEKDLIALMPVALQICISQGSGKQDETVIKKATELLIKIRNAAMELDQDDH
ncbi:MAG: hypothetical protein R3213_09330 [Flavobacteriaceae bacterium]|nr:hypothetical protein [Flavobacteriaceae bacterium]